MARIFGFDIGTTSIGSAVIDQDIARGTGQILRLGVRIFPEARDPDGTPLNQTRRQKRMARRQLRRRRVRRKLLNECLHEFGLLPPFNSPAWHRLMTLDPLDLRRQGLTETLEPEQLGRALYHLSKRRHFKGRDLDEEEEEKEAEKPDEKQAKTNRDSTLQQLRATGKTLGELLSDRRPHERKRGVHANRAAVVDEFERFWTAQAAHHAVLNEPVFRARIEDAIFAQRPVFWRKSTLGTCRYMPGSPLCPKGSWLSQERRMLEKLNNLALSGGNARPLDDEERNAILQQLRGQASMSWGGVRNALKPIYKARGEAGLERGLKFNLEVGGDTKLPGNLVEAKLVTIFGDDWATQPHRQAIRDAVHHRLWSADYGEIGDQRVVILADKERKQRRVAAARSFIDDFGIGNEQAAALAELKLPSGWEPYSTAALEKFLPHLEAGTRFGALVNAPEYAAWRAATFPNREQPTGEILDRLPSPADREEQRRINALRNPTVVRTQNELRKVVNNLIGLYGKPDLIRVELAREVGKSKREREEMQNGLRAREKERKKAADDLKAKGIADPSHDDIEKWLLWKECGEFDPYSGHAISFDALFRNAEFEVEHIWPRWKSLDNSFANKTLCLKQLNARKTNSTPFEAFGHDPDWPRMKERMWERVKANKMAAGKAKRFCREEPLDDDFASRQLNDTGYAAKQAVIFLKRLWPDIGIEAPVTVQAVSGRVTAQLRRAWGLNNILSDDGEKTRADHRHHAVDALVVACTHPGLTQRLSNYLQAKEDPTAQRPHLPPPWPGIRGDADKAVAEIVVSHRVRKKVSGPLHKETTYGDTGTDVKSGGLVYREFVTRKKVEALTKGELAMIRDPVVRDIVIDWVASHGGDPKKAFAAYPRVGGPKGAEIRKVRLISKQQVRLMAEVSTGYADLGSNHHVAIYRLPNGKVDFEVVSLLKAMRRLANRQPVVSRGRQAVEAFLMSLCPGDTIRFAKVQGEPPGLWRVQKIASKGQISLLSLTDASPKEPSLFEPMVGGIISRNAVKVSIDPIGRIRTAND